MVLWRQATLLLCFALGVVVIGGGLFNLIYELEPNRCQMTYMNPSYDPIALPSPEELTTSTGFAPLVPPPLALKYEFYRYYEGGRQVSTTDGPTIPVLFIPGSGGSFRQTRSLAGITLQRSRPADARRSTFAFYTLYFQEEMSGVDGVALEAQVLFTNEAVRWILEHHGGNGGGGSADGQRAEGFVPIDVSTNGARKKRTTKTTAATPAAQSVVLVAHSMGGVVARACLSAANYRKGSIRTIITLNTPHLAPVAVLQSELADHYISLLSVWSNASNFAAPDGPLNDVAVLSIAGSFRDTLIPSELAYMQEFETNHSVSLLTSSITGVWLETDHECILWCRQLTQALSSLLFQLVDPRTGMDTRSLNDRLRIFKSLSASRLAALLLLTAEEANEQTIDSVSDPLGFAMKQARQDAPARPLPVTDSKLIALLTAPDLHELDEDIVHFRAVEHTTYRFVNRGAPSTSFFFLTNGAAFHLILCRNGVADNDDQQPLDATACEEWTHLAETLPGQPHSEASVLSLLVLEPSIIARTTVYIVFPKYGRPWSQGVFFGAQALSLPKERIVIDTTPLLTSNSVLLPAPHSFFSVLSFGSFSRTTPLRYSLHFNGCQRRHGTPGTGTGTGTAVLPPLAYHLSSSTLEQVFVPNVTSTRFRFHQTTDQPVYLAFISDPDCSYTISLSFDIRSYLGLICRSNYQLAYLLLAWLLLAVLVHQLSSFRRLGLCPSFFSSLRSVVSLAAPIICVLLPLANHLAFDQLRSVVASLFQALMISVFPLHRSPPSPTDFALLFAASALLALSLAGALNFLRICLSILARIVGPSLAALILAPRPKPLVVVASVVAATFIHPGIGIIITLFSLLRATTSPNIPLSTRNFLETVFLIDFTVFLLVMPSLVIWAKNLPFISFVDLIKWNSSTVFVNLASIHSCLARFGPSKGSKASTLVLVALAAIVVVYGPVCAMAEFRTFTFASLVLVLLCFDHLLALSQVAKTEKFT